MLTALLILILVLILLFGFVLLFGAPYLPTLKPQIDEALNLAELRPGQTLVELGCGDGRVLLAAAERGAYAIGYELNPLLVLVSKIRTFRHRKKVRVIWGNFWTQQLPKTDVVFVFLLQKYMAKLDTKIEQEKQGTVKLVSFTFTIPDRKIDATHKGVHLYVYDKTNS